MQHQKQYVLAPTQRKQMRSQRHLARKIKTSLRRSRQRSRKLPFAHPTNRKPNPRRSNSQNLLPRNPKPLREDRAQALVPLNNIPKRSFQRPHIQFAAKPNRQRDRVASAAALQPLQEPQPTLPIRQRHLGRTLHRTQRRPLCTPRPPPPSDNAPPAARSPARTAARVPPASPNRSTSPATVGASNRLRIETSKHRLERKRLIKRHAHHSDAA